MRTVHPVNRGKFSNFLTQISLVFNEWSKNKWFSHLSRNVEKNQLAFRNFIMAEVFLEEIFVDFSSRDRRRF